MSVLGLSGRDRMLMYNCVDLLPDLECDVFLSEVIIPVIEESFVSGLDDWWPNFVADTCL
jgi:hypothetical protein